MNKEEMIIKYLENQLSTAEQHSFEKQLSESPELKTELVKYVKINQRINELRKIESNQLYFNSLLPRFHEKMKIRSALFEYKKVGYVFSVLIMLVVSYAIFSLFYYENEQGNLINFAESLTPDEKIELLRTLNDVTATEYLNGYYSYLLNDELEIGLSDISEKKQIAVSYDLYMDNFEEIVTEKEFENIYNKLLSTKFFNEERL